MRLQVPLAYAGLFGGLLMAAAAQPQATATYSDITPIFVSRCAKCHTQNGLMGPAPEGYRLTSDEATLSAADRVRVVPGNRLDGLVLDIGPGTRIDKNPVPGDYVEVRGRLDDSGRVIVERLRPR